MTHRVDIHETAPGRFRTLWCLSADLGRTLLRDVRENETVLAIVPGGVLKPDHLQIALERTDYHQAKMYARAEARERNSSFPGDR